MSGLNKMTLIGNVGSDVRIQEGKHGKNAHFNVAVNDRWRDKTSGEMQEKTQWFGVSIWQESLANYAEKYLGKGSKVYVEGSARLDEWESQKTGQTNRRIVIDIRGYNCKVILLNPGNAKKDEAPFE